jgi:hypothetical protein
MLLGVAAAILVSNANPRLDPLAGVIIVASIVLGIVVAGIVTRYSRDNWS